MGIISSIGSGIKSLFVLDNLVIIGCGLFGLLILRGWLGITISTFLSPLIFLLGEGITSAIMLIADFLMIFVVLVIARAVYRFFFGGKKKC